MCDYSKVVTLVGTSYPYGGVKLPPAVVAYTYIYIYVYNVRSAIPTVRRDPSLPSLRKKSCRNHCGFRQCWHRSQLQLLVDPSRLYDIYEPVPSTIRVILLCDRTRPATRCSRAWTERATPGPRSQIDFPGPAAVRPCRRLVVVV